jgi:ribosomal protein S18 acetylase RimI-like enzyme
MQKEGLIIKKALQKDLKSIAEIFKIESAKPPYNKKKTPKNALGGIKKDFKGNDIYIAIVDNNIVGFIMVWMDSGIKHQLWINELWVLKKYQGQGIGKKLMNEIEKIYKKKGIKIFKLVAHTEKGGARDFYKKVGYNTDKSMVYMEKMIR